tara:strand:- start:2082 stop:3311 length:1230 start_codon:yes stop_codon:yes gene_type:complete
MASKLDLLELIAKGGRDGLKAFYDIMSDRMELPTKKRIQPDPDRERILDTDYKTPSEVTFSEDLGRMYPRNPNPLAPLPLKDRARPLIKGRQEIADKLTEKILKSGITESDARFFYSSDGPIYRAALKAGLSKDEAAKYLDDFSKYFAATSPRTPVESNIRNATSVMAKLDAGIPFRELVGKGSGGISEKGYPMMTGKGGIHGKLLDDIAEFGSIDRATNTKPATFGANMIGNRSGVTVDTHAIRGALMAMNEVKAGSVPDGFILPKFKAAYKKDPKTLTPNMIDDTIGTQVIEVDGRKVKAQTEYPIFADIYDDVAKKLDVEPAESQALSWFGLGDETNLMSDRKTVSDIFDERINVTAKELGISPKEVAKLVFNRKIPLMGVAGAGGLLGSYQNNERDLLRYLSRGM